MSENKNAPQTHLRVLIVENDPIWRRDHRENLTLCGYDIYVAEPTDKATDKLQSLQEDAVTKAKDYRCQIAVVDMRLRSDDDPSDRSGLELVPKLAPAVSIICTGWEHVKLAMESLQSPPDPPFRPYAFVGKQDGPAKLQEAIEKTERTYWPYLRNEIDLIAEGLSSRTRAESYFAENEVQSLLRQVFVGRRELRLMSLSSTGRPQGLSLRSRSLVLKAIPDKEEAVVVKVARTKRVQEERANYEQSVSRFFPGRFYARFKRSERMWEWGCAVYEFMGSIEPNMRLFTDYYIQETEQRVCSALDQFGENLGRLYSRTREQSPKSLFLAYKDAWGEEWCARLDKFRAASHLPAVYSNWKFPDPVQWLQARVNLANPSERDTTRSLPRLDTAIIHGDLHGENMFVDSRGDIWVIDYERSGRGPILQDWVELENDILTRLVPLDAVDCSAFVELVIRLLTPGKIDGVKLRTTDKGESRKALKVLQKLRMKAKDTTGVDDVQLYLWSLLLNVIYRLMYWQEHADESEESQAQLQRCLLLGALICHRLENIETNAGAWPPREWTGNNSKRTGDMAAPTVPQFHQAQVLKLQLTDLRNSQRQFKAAVLEVPDKQPYAVSVPPYQGDGLVGVVKLIELGEYQPDKFTPAQKAALQQLGLLQGDSLLHNWRDRVGHDLFEALLPAKGGVRREFENAFYTDRKGGELHLVFDKDATDLACQPWELLHDGFPDEPRSAIDIIRYVASDRAAQELAVPAPPCRILYVSARPRGLAQLEHDRDAIKKSVASAAKPSQILFEELEESGRPAHTHQALKTRLLDTSKPPIHVLHFDGHGTFSRLCPDPDCQTPNQPHLLVCEGCNRSLAEVSPRGYLLFETSTGGFDLVDTIRLLEGIPRSQVRLVVLASCQSARVRNADLLMAGVGPGLILGGVPAMVAMQFSIASFDAISFNQEFYKALVQGDTLPNAVNRARTMLPEPGRWSPVLYLRSKDHQVHLCPQA